MFVNWFPFSIVKSAVFLISFNTHYLSIIARLRYKRNIGGMLNLPFPYIETDRVEYNITFLRYF